MTSQLTRVQERFKDDGDVFILSHTVDPETDSVSILRSYADKYNANSNMWSFVTGSKKELYDIAFKGYLVNALEAEENAEEAFIHSELFILLDKEKHIRGIYDGTSTVEVNKLIDDIKVLKAEYAIKEHAKANER